MTYVYELLNTLAYYDNEAVCYSRNGNHHV